MDPGRSRARSPPFCPPRALRAVQCTGRAPPSSFGRSSKQIQVHRSRHDASNTAECESPSLGPYRLAIMAALVSVGRALTSIPSSRCCSLAEASGHSSAALEEGALVGVEKEFVGRKPHTTYYCTRKGRSEMKAYLGNRGGRTEEGRL